LINALQVIYLCGEKLNEIFLGTACNLEYYCTQRGQNSRRPVEPLEEEEEEEDCTQRKLTKF
jgi:hypothetical protein